jgi:hypothetical protein
MAEQMERDAANKTAAAEAAAAQARLAVELGKVQAERAQAEQARVTAEESLLKSELEFVAKERETLALIDQKLVQQRAANAAEVRAAKAIELRLELEKQSAAAAKSRADAEEQLAEVARQREEAETAFNQAEWAKLAEQKTLVDTVHAHAEMQRRVAATTAAMVESKKKLLEQETRRQHAAQNMLNAMEEKAAHPSDEHSETMARDVIGRLKETAGSVWRGR